MSDKAKAVWYMRLWDAFVPNVGKALARFPMAVLMAALGTGYYLFELENYFGHDKNLEWRPFVGFALAFFWSVMVGLYFEAKGENLGRRWGVLVAGFIAIALLVVYARTIELFPPLILAAAVLATGVAAHLRMDASNDGLWVFNHQLWLGAALAFVGASLFAAGVSAIIETLRYLFDLGLPRSLHAKIWIIAMGLIGPLNWLTLVPREFDQPLSSTSEEFTARAISILVNYILVPLLLIYTIILYVYAGKILLDGVLPKGRLGWMVLGYGAIGTSAVLMAYPDRERGGPLVRFFWRYWFGLTSVPIFLLLLAGYVRIADYGVTEERYLVMLAGGWLALLLVVYGLPDRARDLRIAIYALALVLLVASAGPWGAVGWSVRSQKAQLAGLLEEAGILSDGKIQPAKLEEFSGFDRRTGRVSSILWFLHRHERLRDIRPWFEGLENDPFVAANKWQLRTNLAKLLKSTGGSREGARRRFGYNLNKAGWVELAEGQRLLGPYRVYRAGRAKVTPLATKEPVALNFELKIAGLDVHDSQGRSAQFDLLDMANRLQRESTKQAQYNIDSMPKIIERSSGPLEVALMPANLHGTWTENGGLEIRTIEFWLVVGDAELIRQ